MLPGDFVRRGVFAGKFGKSKQLSSTYPNFFNFSDFPNTTFPIFSTKAKIPRCYDFLGIFFVGKIGKVALKNRKN